MAHTHTQTLTPTSTPTQVCTYIPSMRLTHLQTARTRHFSIATVQDAKDTEHAYDEQDHGQDDVKAKSDEGDDGVEEGAQRRARWDLNDAVKRGGERRGETRGKWHKRGRLSATQTARVRSLKDKHIGKSEQCQPKARAERKRRENRVQTLWRYEREAVW